jgi:apolipoprotein N-acyltransferase
MVAGSGSRPLAAAGLRLADALCFDVAFDDVIYPQVVGGAELLTVQTSNATYINTEQVDQQFAIERTRALETGRWTAVAATNGVTGIIRPDGSVVRRLPRRTQGYVLTRVGLTRGVPPGVRVGPWLGRGAALVTVLAALAAVGRYPRRRVRPASPAGGTGRPAPQAAGTARQD